jgi:acyl carrier protein
LSEESMQARVLRAVHAALQGALELEPDEISGEASIINDLDAESIDLLDIRFRLEKALGLKITQEELAEAFNAAESAEEFRRLFTVDAMCRYLVSRMEKLNE